MEIIVFLFLGLSLVLYILLGGADFGVGIVELFISSSRKKEIDKVSYRAIGPIWEANHMWLILVVVILFVGFPRVYTELSISLHIPLTLMLFGIIARGCAFTFRHYDAITDRSQYWYSLLFRLSSLLTPFLLGICAGAMIYGRINPQADDFFLRFISPWFNPFCIGVGIFLCSICSYLAATFLIAEARSIEDKQAFVQVAKISAVIMFLTGGAVLVVGQATQVPFKDMIFASKLSQSAFVVATIAFVIYGVFLVQQKHESWNRILAGVQVTSILVGWFAMQFPSIIRIQNTQDITFYNGVSGAKTILALGLALLIGSLLILPAFFYLIYIFKIEGNSKRSI